MINFFLHASILQFYSSFYIEKMFTIFHSTSFFFLNDKSNKKNINFQIFLSLIIFKTQNWIKVFHLKTKRIFGVKSSDVFGSPITIICMRYYIHNYISPWFRIQPFPSEFEILHPTLQTHASFSFFFSFTENSLLMVNNSRVCRH